MLGKPTIRMPTAIDPSIVKIAVELENHTAQLIEFDQKNPLTGIIRSLCQNWNVNDDENYALQFCEPNNKNYVTEKNRNEVKNGSVLRLRHSPAKTAHDTLEILKTGVNTEKSRVLEQLAQLSSDPTFALEFIKNQGINMIIQMIESECIGEMLKFAMLSFVELMDHGTISWENLPTNRMLIKCIKYINCPSTVLQEVVQSSLCILENVLSSRSGSVVDEVTLDNLLALLGDTTSQIIKQNTIALINALFVKGNDDKKREIANILSTKKFRTAIIETVNSANIGISHQLYILQTLTLNLLESRMIPAQLNAQDQDANDKIKELRRIAFDESVYGDAAVDVQSRRHNSNGNAGYYKKLGFKCDINPAQDFIETPPGMLALDCMIYFARNYTQQYTKVVHENSCRADEHECPFGRTSIELVKLLCEILHIGESPTEQGQDFHPMFFTHDHPFEEFFCICVVILNKTWKDMRATHVEDFAKVFSVLSEQIQRTLKIKPNNFDDFKAKIQTLTYATITTLRQQERASREECESTATAIVSLKEKISPEIISLIKAQRLGYLVEGTRFSKYSKHGGRTKDKYWYARLSPNHKVIHYGDCDEKSVPTLEELCQKIQVCEMKQLLVGKECPHMNMLRTRKSAANLIFSITIDTTDQSNQTLDFVAPDELTFFYWTDGINALLGQSMVSKQMEEDFETLLSMEIKLRLLDAEGVDISQDPPPIPDDPLDYDFCFES